MKIRCWTAEWAYPIFRLVLIWVGIIGLIAIGSSIRGWGQRIEARLARIEANMAARVDTTWTARRTTEWLDISPLWEEEHEPTHLDR